MTTQSNRVRKNGILERSAPQVEIPATKQPDICKEVADAFIELDNAASAAVALAMMNASHIEDCIHDYASWEDFDLVTFKAGNGVLPRLLETTFYREFHIWDEDRNRIVELHNRPEASAAGVGTVPHGVEEAVYALNHLIKLQGQEISNHHDDHSWACSDVVMKSLKSAFQKAWDTYHKLKVVVRTQSAGTISQAA